VKAIQIGRAIRDIFRCPTCGKSRLLANTAGYRRPVAIEAFDPERHCSCPPPRIGEPQMCGVDGGALGDAHEESPPATQKDLPRD